MNQRPCRYGDGCRNSKCLFAHTNRMKCRYLSECKSRICTFDHTPSMAATFKKQAFISDEDISKRTAVVVQLLDFHERDEHETMYDLLRKKMNEQAVGYKKWLLAKELFCSLPIERKNFVPIEFIGNKDAVLKVLENECCHSALYKYVTNAMIRDVEFNLRLIALTSEAFYHTPIELKKDRRFTLDAVRANPSIYEFLHDRFKNDEEITIEAVKNKGELLGCASRDMRANRGVVLHAVSNDGKAIMFASNELKEDENIVTAASKSNPQAKQFAKRKVKEGKVMKYESRRQRANRELDTFIHSLEELFENLEKQTWQMEEQFDEDKLDVIFKLETGKPLNKIPAKWGDDRDIILRAVSYDYLNLRFVRKKWKADKEIILHAFRNDTAALNYADPSLLNDRAFMLELINEDEEAYLFVSPALQVDPEFLLDAVVRNPVILINHMPDLLLQKGFMMSLVRRLGDMLQYSPLSNKDLQIEAVKQNGYVLAQVMNTPMMHELRETRMDTVYNNCYIPNLLI